MRRKTRADERCSLHDIEDARGKSCFIREFSKQLTNRRGLLARLEDDGVAKQQRRHNVTIGQVRGEIERSKHCHHAMRLEGANA